MIEKIEGIITDIVKHNDKHNVVTLYTRSKGRMAFLVPVGKSKAGKMRNATINLMTVISADVNIRGEKELFLLRNINPEKVWHQIYLNPLKSSLLFFITEFTNRLVRQYPSDEKLWDFLVYSLETLETIPTKSIANFHLAMLIRLLPVAGISPGITFWERGLQFDMLSAEMIDRRNPVFLKRTALISEEESKVVPVLLKMNYRNMSKFHFTQKERNQILDGILRYYSVHLPIGNEYRSLSVLREIFA